MLLHEIALQQLKKLTKQHLKLCQLVQLEAYRTCWIHSSILLSYILPVILALPEKTLKTGLIFICKVVAGATLRFLKLTGDFPATYICLFGAVDSASDF